MVGASRFIFLNEEHELHFPEGWNDCSHQLLWNYNLHYFDDLNAEESELRREWHDSYLKDWLEHNPIGTRPAWDSYPTSLRIVNWTKWAISQYDHPPNMHASLAQQARWISRKLEFHLQANHLWANAKALLFAGCYFDCAESDKWLAKGSKILLKQLNEQILSDGGHFELSPMYHAIILEDVIDMIQLDRMYPGIIPEVLIRGLRSRIRPMFDWLSMMSHSDDQLSFFNDSAQGIAPSLAELKRYAKQVQLKVSNKTFERANMLPDSGYIRLEQGDISVICDVGEIGPEYQPGHGHADTLSFELTVEKQKVFVNSGVGTYEEGTEREFQRSTAAHNTVEVDGENSSEVWGGFRVARRANPLELSIDYSIGGEVCVSCSHDGYSRLSGRVIHRRLWKLESKQLMIFDRLEGLFTTATARFYLHPDALLSEGTNNSYKVSIGRKTILFEIEEGEVKVKDTEYYPEFGKAIPNKCLEVRFLSDRIGTRLSWI